MPMPRSPSRRQGARAERPRPPSPAPRKPRASRPAAEGCPYLYGIIRAAKALDFGPVGLGAPPARLGTVHHGALAAVVSEGPRDVPEPTRDNLLAHARAQDRVLREHTLLPTAFGLVLDSRQDVEALLRAGADTFEAALTRLEGQVELGLQVLCQAREGEEAWARARRDAAALVDALRALAVDCRLGAPVGERMVLNAAFLVSRERVEDFDARVRSLTERHGALNVRTSGPWPPYHFVDIRLRLEAEAH